MGGGHSVENLTTNLTSSITNLITNSYQTAGVKSLSQQYVEMDCTDYMKEIQKNQLTCISDSAAYAATRGWSEAETTEYTTGVCKTLSCNPSCCEGDNLTLENILTLNINDEQYNNIKSNVSNDLTSTVETSAKQSNIPFTWGDKTKNDTKNLEKSVTNIIDNLKSNLGIDVSTTQTIKIKGGKLSFVTLKDARQIIDKHVQTMNKDTQAITKLATDIKASASQTSSSSILTWLIAIVLILLIILICYLIYKKLKNRNKNKGGDDGKGGKD